MSGAGSLPEGMDGGTAAMMMIISAMIEPIHDWLTGEVAYLTGQGFTPAQARAMAAATYTMAFGSRIGPDAADPGGGVAA